MSNTLEANVSNHNRKKARNQKGVALIIALVILFLLSALAASLIFVTQSEMWASSNYRLLTQSRYAAEAGAQAAANWFAHGGYTAPTTFTSFDMTKSPVACKSGGTCPTVNSPIVLGGSAPNYPDSTVETAFYNAFNNQTVPGLTNATYSVTAQLMQMQSGALQTWQITSVGNMTSARGATTQVIETIQRSGTPIFNYGLYATSNACPKSIDFSGSAQSDSFNSTLGAYGGANIGSQGNMGTPGSVGMSGTAAIHGTLATNQPANGGCPDGLNSSSSVAGPPPPAPPSPGVTGGFVSLNAPTYGPPAFPSPFTPGPTSGSAVNYNSGTTNLTQGTFGNIQSQATLNFAAGNYAIGNLQGNNGVVTMGAGNYTINDISLSGTILHLNTGVYNIDSLAMSGSASVVIDSGPVVININPSTATTPVNMSGSSNITNNTLIPANLEITYGGSLTMQLSGSSLCMAVVYAPSAPIQMSGSSGWYGAIIGSTFQDSGSAAMHYDTALQNSFLTNVNSNLVGFTWSKN